MDIESRVPAMTTANARPQALFLSHGTAGALYPVAPKPGGAVLDPSAAAALREQESP